jgi:hypothetical protein
MHEIWKLANTLRARPSNAMKTTVELDASNRIVLSREGSGDSPVTEAARIGDPGAHRIGSGGNASGRIIKRGKLKVWTGAVLATPIGEAIAHSRH